MKLLSIILIASHLCKLSLAFDLSLEKIHVPLDSGSVQGINAYLEVNLPPIAVNDTLFLYTGCGRDRLVANILANDFDPNGDEIRFYSQFNHRIGTLQINKSGDLRFHLKEPFEGTIEFEYVINELSRDNFKALGKVLILVKPDTDCDDVADEYDLDNDNDGIPNNEEGKIDTDGDGLPNYRDIDSDNDGIPDNVEWQCEYEYISPSNTDINRNGWDDAYDTFTNGKFQVSLDTDLDGIPDYIDKDSDGDLISDRFEANGSIFKEIDGIQLLNKDSDYDGLDDAFDSCIISPLGFNSIGSKSPLPDSDFNGIRDWRDNQRCKKYFTIYPNPADVHTNIVMDGIFPSSHAKVKIYNLKGSLVETFSINSISNRINVTNYSNGVYILAVTIESYTGIQKLIVSH